jgi:hypothetical protein
MIENMIWVVHPGLDPDFLSIPDPGSRGQKGTGSGFATLIAREFHKLPSIL